MPSEPKIARIGANFEELLLSLRNHLVKAFRDTNVHADFEKAFASLPRELRGAKPEGQLYTPWQLLEHLRLCVRDYVDYATQPGYIEPPFPEGYWPSSDTPPDDAAWEASLRGFRSGMAEMESLILNPRTDLFAPIPGGEGRKVLRQALACLDHNAYHIGQMILLRRLSGAWSEK